MENDTLIRELRAEAQDIGVFFPLIEQTDALEQTENVHGQTVVNRAVLCIQAGNDADENGAPTADTIARYTAAVREKQYGIVWLEPAAVSADARYYDQGLVFCKENIEAFRALVSAVREASLAAFGTAPLMIALLDHAGHHALKPVAMEHSESLPTDAPILSDDDLTQIMLACGAAAKAAEEAGFAGAALNAADRSLFGESLAAFHRDGKFGGDFDDRTRFLRDCYTAMKMVTTDKLFYTIRLCLSDGIEQPDGWGMAFEDLSAPDLYEPALLMKILQALYGVKMVLCSIGIPDVNWMLAAEPESDLIRYSRLCTCVAMLDSDMQQNVQLILPELESAEIPFENLAAGMIQGEFASFAGFTAR